VPQEIKVGIFRPLNKAIVRLESLSKTDFVRFTHNRNVGIADFASLLRHSGFRYEGRIAANGYDG
jgi:hypothetical protein